MDQRQIQDKLLEIIRDYLPEEVSVEEVTPEKDLINDLKINSAYMVDIVIGIEEAFDIMIEDDVIGEINTVQQSIDIISRKIAEKA